MSLFIRDPDVRDRSYDPLRERLGSRLDIAKTAYLIVEISRERVLEDALDQLFKREKRELMRPLKVRFTDEGEEGVDHGGVQQEFFILALREALKPEYGMFTTDPRTRMTWFQVNPLEPLHKFELLGLLFSLAVYNGETKVKDLGSVSLERAQCGSGNCVRGPDETPPRFRRSCD